MIFILNLNPTSLSLYDSWLFKRNQVARVDVQRLVIPEEKDGGPKIGHAPSMEENVGKFHQYLGDILDIRGG